MAESWTFLTWILKCCPTVSKVLWECQMCWVQPEPPSLTGPAEGTMEGETSLEFPSGLQNKASNLMFVFKGTCCSPDALLRPNQELGVLPFYLQRKWTSDLIPSYYAAGWSQCGLILEFTKTLSNKKCFAVWIRKMKQSTIACDDCLEE